MGSCGLPIELIDNIPFFESEWIAKRKKNMPMFLPLGEK